MISLLYGDTIMVHNGNNTQAARYTGAAVRVPVGTYVNATIADSICVRRPVCSVVRRAEAPCSC